MARRGKLPVIRIVIESWRLLLRWPQATLVTMILSVLWLHGLLRAASLLSYLVNSSVSGVAVEGRSTGVLGLAVSGLFILTGVLVLAALVMVLWERATTGMPTAQSWSGQRALMRAVGKSALLLAALAALWGFFVALLSLPLGLRPMFMEIPAAHWEMSPVDATDLYTDATLIALLGVCIVAAHVPARLALGLPRVAVGKAVDVRGAWLLSVGNGWRLLATILLVLLPVWLAGMVLDQDSVPQIDRAWHWWVREELHRSLNGLMFAVLGVVLTLCHHTLDGTAGQARESKENSG